MYMARAWRCWPGDALLNKAFETAAEAFSMIGEAADIAARYAAVAKALQILANKAGIYGMIADSAAEICAESCRQIR